MKAIIILAVLLTTNSVFSQSKSEAEVLHLSNKIFGWEVENNITSVEQLLHEKCKVVNSRGEIQTKEQYLTTLRNGTFKHDSIALEQSTVTLVGNTATVIGKGGFHMTVSGAKVHRHLSYMEVFAKDDRSWKLIAIYVSVLSDK